MNTLTQYGMIALFATLFGSFAVDFVSTNVTETTSKISETFSTIAAGEIAQ